MQWQDEAVILGGAPFGERDAVLDVLSATHGRWRGFVKAGQSRRVRGTLQPGNRIAVRWSARLADQLGRFQVESLHSPLGTVLGRPDSLAALTAATAVVATSLPERTPEPGTHGALLAFLNLLERDRTPLEVLAAGLVRLEMGILTDLGYGLDLTGCAGGGPATDLAYVSPRTGRAVSAIRGGPHADKLLPLPGFMLAGGQGLPGPVAARDGLAVTGYFLSRHVWVARPEGMPAARARLITRLESRLVEARAASDR
ncbi:DNA repair protein RecO [Yunchengibacter salinarum]|uniref:DNA repair protein RecO n=1 Tax=Yunchengibacter salinarum TaxID=3133399 RepID=UPI0035B5A8C3